MDEPAIVREASERRHRRTRSIDPNPVMPQAVHTKKEAVLAAASGARHAGRNAQSNARLSDAGSR